MAIVKNVKELDQIDPFATYLLLISPEEIPHLAIVSGGEYYSLTHKKVFLSEPFTPYLKFLQRTNRKMLFIEVSGETPNLRACFGKYKKTGKAAETCFVPVKESLMPASNSRFVFELIPDLYDANRITGAFHLNMENDLTPLGDFNLSTYPKEAIFSYIESLNEKYVKRE